MNKLKYTQKYATATCITPTGQLEEVKVPAVQVTPLDGKVYRLLRPNECVKDGISAKSKGSNVTAAYHVAWGSTIKKLDSKYISTFRQLDDAISMSSKNQWLNGDIVSIDVDKAPVTVVHVWDAYVRRQLILEQYVTDPQTIYNFNKFAEYNNEVLLVGDVPADCIEIEIDKQSLPNCVGNIAV